VRPIIGYGQKSCYSRNEVVKEFLRIGSHAGGDHPVPRLGSVAWQRAIEGLSYVRGAGNGG